MCEINKDKIISHFGEDFYEKVRGDLGKYATLWGLSDFVQIDYYSINCIFKCISKKHGLSVLKIGGLSNSRETENECRILREYDGGRFCKVCEADTDNGVLLIEQITPGTPLRAEPSLNKRLDVFHEISCGLHKTPADKTAYPTYMGWVSRITEYMRGRKDYAALYEKMAEAERICRELCVKYSGETLLHGDLHHDNILKGADGSYRIIDPKGVVGDEVFDIPRFILNEFGDDVMSGEFRDKFARITRTVSEKFDIPECDVLRLTHVETCMANCWNVESGLEPDMEQILFTIYN